MTKKSTTKQESRGGILKLSYSKGLNAIVSTQILAQKIGVFWHVQYYLLFLLDLRKLLKYVQIELLLDGQSVDKDG